MEFQDELIRIGAFGRITQLSRKALRLYDQLGILSPTYIDPDSGYRYYATAQVATARFVRQMREAEMPLALIRQVIDAEQAEIDQLITDYHSEFEARVVQARNAIRRLQAHQRHKECSVSFDIQIRQVPQQQIISIKRALTQPEMGAFIQGSIATLLQMVEDQGLTITNEVMGLYYGPINANDTGPLEVAFPVAGTATPQGDVVVRELPAHTVAYATGKGEYYDFPAVLQVWDAVADWINANGYKEAKHPITCYEVWHKDRLEVAWPFEPK